MRFKGIGEWFAKAKAAQKKHDKRNARPEVYESRGLTPLARTQLRNVRRRP